MSICVLHPVYVLMCVISCASCHGGTVAVLCVCHAAGAWLHVQQQAGTPAGLVYDVVAMLPPVACVSVQLLPWLCMTVLVICVNSTSAVPSVQL